MVPILLDWVMYGSQCATYCTDFRFQGLEVRKLKFLKQKRIQRELISVLGTLNFTITVIRRQVT